MIRNQLEQLHTHNIVNRYMLVLVHLQLSYSGIGPCIGFLTASVILLAETGKIDTDDGASDHLNQVT
jgi:hypothetical protein